MSTATTVTWETKEEDTSALLQSDNIENTDVARLEKIGHKIQIAIKRGDRTGKFEKIHHNETIVGGFTWEDYQIAMVASADKGKTVSEVIMKTIYDRINFDLFEVLAKADNVDRRYEIFKDKFSKAMKSAKELLVRQKTATQERAEANEDLGEFTFLVLIKDPEGYLHWSALGDIHLIGFGEDHHIIKEINDRRVTHRTTPDDITFGYVLNSWDYILIGTRSTVNRINLDEYTKIFHSTIDFTEKVKLILNSAVETDPNKNIAYAVMNTK